MNLRTTFLVATVAIWSISANAATWYVDVNNAGSQDGLSWTTAFREIQAAVNAATSGDEVWVADGTYNEQRTASATGSLEMKAGVDIYGGFAGTETLLADRRHKTNVAIIDGINGRGAGIKAYHVVRGADNATLEGFVIQNGEANGATLLTKQGGGMNSVGVSPTIRYCTFRANRADSVGAGLTTISSSAVVDACIFYDNVVDAGSAADGNGGAIAACTGGVPTISNCLFYDNAAKGNSSATGGGTGGGAIIVSAQNPVIKNCTFSRNDGTARNANEGGGGAILMTNNSVATIKNCIMWGNSPDEIATSAQFGGSSSTVDHCIVQNGYTLGTSIQTSDPAFVNAGTNDFHIGSGSPARNSGVADASVTRDLDGTKRILEAAIDEGAYEYDANDPTAACISQLIFLANLGNVNPVQGTYDIIPSDVNNGSTDAGGIEYYSLSQSHFTCADITAPGFPTSVTLSVTDYSGRVGTCVAQVDVRDVNKPVITQCAANQFVPTDNNCQAVVPDFTSGPGGVIADDNCGIASRTQSPLAGTLISTTTSVTITVTDSTGNLESCSAFAVPTDLSGPAFTTCPTGRTIFVNGSCQASIPDLTTEAVAADACGGAVTITQSQTPGTPVTIGAPITVTLTATDVNNNANSSCTVLIAVQDSQDPQFTVCPPAQVVASDGSCAGVIPDVVALATVNDNCALSSVVQVPTAGTAISSALTVVTITATDSSNNTSTCNVNVTLEDQTDPQILNCPSDTLVTINGSCQGSVPDLTGGVIASDNCTNFVVTQSPLAGSAMSVDTLVTLTVTDDAGNTSTCTANALIDDQVDPTVVQCAPNTTVNLDSSCNATIPDLTSQVNATDNCAVATITQLPTAGTVITADTTVTFTITDTHSNTSTCTADVLVQDVEAPSITTCAGNVTLFLDNNCNATMPDVTASVVATDTCSLPVTVTQDPVAGATIHGITTVTITVTDASGNAAQCTSTAFASDNTAPVIDTCASDVTLDFNGNCQVVLPDLRAAVTATDECAVTVTQSPAPGTIITTNTTLTFTVTDSGGEDATCTADVTVQDATGPVVTLNGPASVTLPVNSVYVEQGATANDNCDGPRQVFISGGPVNTSSPHVYTLVYSATDTHGNVGSTNRTVTIGSDLVPPVITLNGANSLSVNCGDGFTDPGATAIDNADGNISANIVVSGGPITSTSPPAVYQLFYNVSDSSGNAAVTKVRTVTVLDNCPLAVHIVGPALVERAEGDNVTLEVTVSGAIGPVTLQWEYETSPGVWTPAGGLSNGLTYTINNIAQSDFGRYRVSAVDSVTTALSPVITLRDVNAVPAFGLLGLAALGGATALGGALGLRRRKN